MLRWNIVGTEQLEEDNSRTEWFWIAGNRAHPRITEILLFLFFKLGFLKSSCRVLEEPAPERVINLKVESQHK